MTNFLTLAGLLILIGVFIIVTKNKPSHQGQIEGRRHEKKRKIEASTPKREVPVCHELPVKFQPKLPLSLQKMNQHQILEYAINQTAGLLSSYKDLAKQAEKLAELAKDASRPLFVVVMGEFKTGKSTFINTLLNEEVLTTDVTPATAAVTMLSYGAQREIVAHFQDGSEQSYPFERLASLSAEGDAEGKKIRESLLYLEVKIPNALLKKITVVDTPGLNSDNPLHTRATEYFMERADQVLWVFSYSKAGSRTEVGTLKSLANDLKPIGVVNRIDEHDPEEEDLEEVLSDTYRKLQDTVGVLVGVSAYQASEARMEHDQELWEESRWGQLEQVLQQEVYSKAASKKYIRILSKLAGVLDELDREFSHYKHKYDGAYSLLYEQETYLEKVNGQLNQIEILLGDWNSVKRDDALAPLAQFNPLPDFIFQAQQINNYKEKMLGVYEAYNREYKEIEKKQKDIDFRIRRHNEEFSNLEESYKEYNTSGLFGGRPIFDLDGKGRALQNRENKLNTQANTLNTLQEQISNQYNAFSTRLKRTEDESYEYCQTIIKSLRKTKEQFQKQLRNLDAEKEKAEIQLNELSWVNDFSRMRETYINWEFEKALAAIQLQLGLGDGTLDRENSDIQASLQTILGAVMHVDEEAFAQSAAAVAASETVESAGGGLDLRREIEAAEPGSPVVLKQVRYFLTETLIISESVTLIGSSDCMTEIIMKGEGPALIFNGTGDWTISNIHFRYEGKLDANVVEVKGGIFTASNCKFSGGFLSSEIVDKILGSEETEEVKDGCGLIIEGSAVGTIRDCEFFDNIIGVSAEDQSKVTISSSLFYQNQLVGAAFSEATNSRLENSEVVNCKGAVVCTDHSMVTIKECRIWNGVTGIFLDEQAKAAIIKNEIVSMDAIGISSEGIADQHSSLNLCLYNQLSGICVDEDSSGIIQNNQAENCQHGFVITGNGDPVLDGNLSNKNDHGLLCSGNAKGLLTNNRLWKNERTGIYVTGNSSPTIQKNDCIANDIGILYEENGRGEVVENSLNHNRRFGFYVTGESQVKVRKNIIEKNGDSGIYANDQTRVVLRENVVSDHKEAGIHAEGTANIDCQRNNLTANGIAIVLVGQSGGSIKTNECSGNIAAGILIAEDSTVTVQENNCWNTTEGSGIVVNGGGGNQILNNTCKMNENGILIFNGAVSTVKKNSCSANRNYGVLVEESPRSILENNFCQGNSKGTTKVVN